MTAKSASQVNQAPVQATPQAGRGVLQRKCACGQHTSGEKCSACSKDEPALKRSAIKHGSGRGTEQQQAPSIVHDVLRSPGQPLDAQAREFMESRFRQDFSGVRVHTDSRAARSARAVGAHAYTLGNDIVFGSGRYSPETRDGKSLLAHELTHVAQNRGSQISRSASISIGAEHDRYEAEADENARAIALGNSDSVREVTSSSQPNRLSRATMTVGSTKVDINYSNLVKIPVTDFEKEIETRFASWTGSPATTIHAELTALSNAAKEWVMFALDLLVDNDLPALDKVTAVKRLIAYAPSAKHRALGSADDDFENEALSVSGWFEKALTSGLTKPTSVRTAYVRQRLGTTVGGGSSCPSQRPEALDKAVLKSDLPVKLEAYLKTVQVIANPKNQPFSPLQKIGDAVQEKARKYFAPYADHSRGSGNTVVQQWQYSAHMTSSQSPAGTPGPELRKAYLDSRARIVGEQGLFNTVHFDTRCDDDNNELDKIVTQMESQANIRALVDPILRQKSYTKQDIPKEVIINPQVSAQTDECEARWKTIRTICHELMHVLVHDDFRKADKGRLIMREGWPEVLGHQLYQNITVDKTMTSKMEEGLKSKPCASIPGSTIGYGDAGKKANEIRVAIKDPSFRAAFFLGQLELAAIQPKLSVGTSNDPLEHEADRVADHAMKSSGPLDSHVAHPNIHRHSRPASTELEAPASVGHVVSGPGRPLEPAVRRDMETRLGHDFSRVRVHSDDAASRSARAINAEAYTMGHNIVFGPGRFAPSTQAGRHLLAHELAHVVQQSNSHLVQRKCGPDLGQPAVDCTPSTQGTVGWQFLFQVGCDDLKPGEKDKINKLKTGSRLQIHGFASKDGTDEFNDALSCHRAHRIAELVRAERADCPIIGIFKHGESPKLPPGSLPDLNPPDFWRSVTIQEIAPTPESGETWLDPTSLINRGWDLHARAAANPTSGNLDTIAARRAGLKTWLESIGKTLAPTGSQLSRRKLDDYRRFYASAERLWNAIDTLLAVHKHSAATTDTHTQWAVGTGKPQSTDFHAQSIPAGAKYHIDIFGEGHFAGAINIGMAERTSTTGIHGSRVPNHIFRRFSGKDFNKIPIADKAADLVTSENGPLHLPGLAQEIARIIAPGGTIILVGPDNVEPSHDAVAKEVGGTVTKTFRGTKSRIIETTIVAPAP
jgi:outer membrane protein OmpA-like peptidoglycan-associated protein/Zn-dependent peptidase ImmA (M78 family)